MRQRIRLKESKSNAQQLQETLDTEAAAAGAERRPESSGQQDRGRNVAVVISEPTIGDCARRNLVRNLTRRIDDESKQAKISRIDTNARCKSTSNNSEATKTEKGCATVHGVRYATSQLNKGSAKMTRREFNAVEN